MRATTIRFATVSLLAVAIAGCSSRDNSANPPPSGGTPTPPPTAFEQRFGASFASFFTASNTSDPREPTASDVPAADPAADPLDN